jgi:hypothetical protein
MKVTVPDSGTYEFPDNASVATVKRALALMGVTQAEGAESRVEDNGDITFLRPQGGVKA